MAQNGVISIGQWGVFSHKKGTMWYSHLASQKEGVVTTSIFSNHKTYYGPHYKPQYRTKCCVIRENNITAPITNPIKDTLVSLRIDFNANGSVRRRTSVDLNLFHWPMGKNFGNHNGVCGYMLRQQQYSSRILIEMSIMVIAFFYVLWKPFLYIGFQKT